VYMGLHGLDTLCAKLVKHGMPRSTPIAIVQQGTTQNQRVVTGTLGTLPQDPQVAELHAPTLIIVGGVVTLREKLAWFRPEENAGMDEISTLNVPEVNDEQTGT
jgi:uroporphyrin-III C-methyltransferase / precorrin-2 dehydrogenase / sirohydrochlorin ferrochelatase